MEEVNYSGNQMVLEAILAIDHSFRAVDIVNSTGMERPLVYYHLKKFLELGYIDKKQMVYLILDREALLRELAKSHKHHVNLKAFPTPIYQEKHIKNLNRLIFLTNVCRALSFEHSLRMKREVNKTIESTIESLNAARLGLNRSQMSKVGGKKALKRDRHFQEDLFTYCDFLQIEYDKELLSEELTRVLNEEAEEVEEKEPSPFD